MSSWALSDIPLGCSPVPIQAPLPTQHAFSDERKFLFLLDARKDGFLDAPTDVDYFQVSGQTYHFFKLYTSRTKIKIKSARI